jgi:hypothetical protein
MQKTESIFTESAFTPYNNGAIKGNYRIAVETNLVLVLL